MKQQAYMLMVSLYCTLMIWSAFVSIDRRAVSVASIPVASAASPASR